MSFYEAFSFSVAVSLGIVTVIFPAVVVLWCVDVAFSRHVR